VHAGCDVSGCSLSSASIDTFAKPVADTILYLLYFGDACIEGCGACVEVCTGELVWILRELHCSL
jgi:ferredoxin